MKESKDRTEQFMYSTASAANQAPSSSSLYNIPNCSLTYYLYFQTLCFLTLKEVIQWVMGVLAVLILRAKAVLPRMVMFWL